MSDHYYITNKVAQIVGPCPTFLRGDRVLIFVPSDC